MSAEATATQYINARNLIAYVGLTVCVFGKLTTDVKGRNDAIYKYYVGGGVDSFIQKTGVYRHMPELWSPNFIKEKLIEGVTPEKLFNISL
jgi:hypothetical protein